MTKVQDEAKLFDTLLTLIATHFGNTCEVVLHDLTQDYNHTIVDIRNGHVTNRRIGGCGSNLGLEVLNGSVVDGNRYNYVTTTPDGKILRSSSIYIQNDEGKVVGSICINMNITETIQFEGFLKQYNHFEVTQNEFFAQDVNSLMDYLIRQAKDLIGKEPKDMNKEERIAFISFLDQKGTFQITKSSNRICEVLGISKFTLYNYLDMIRGKESKESVEKA
jgi:predicted transcriptional regulator YheO